MTKETARHERSHLSQDRLVVVHDHESRAWRQGVGIEAGVFIEKGYVRSAEELAEEYAAYEPVSDFIVAERGGIVGGSVRAIGYADGIGFKTLTDIDSGKLEADEEGERLLGSLDLTHTRMIVTGKQ